MRAFRRDHNVCVILKTAYQSIHAAGHKGEVRRAIFIMKHYFYNARKDSVFFFSFLISEVTRCHEISHRIYFSLQYKNVQK